MSCIAIIPARGGSVRIPKKNIKDFRGKPIIAYAIQAAHDSQLFDDIVVSTDDEDISFIASRYGCKVYRRSFDDGIRGTQDVAREVLMHQHWAGVDAACVIYATSPLLNWMDLRRAEETLFRERGAYFAMSVQIDPLADAGCFYFGDAQAFRNGYPLIGSKTIMVPLSTERVCDINTMDDWHKAEEMYDNLLRSEEGKS